VCAIFTKTAYNTTFPINCGENVTDHSPIRTSNLTARGRVILEHVARHRITTPQVLRRVLFAQLSVNAVIKVASRLCRGGFLQRVSLLHRHCYYALTPSAARALGVSHKRTGPLGVQALPAEYAALHFACFTVPQRVRLTSAELKIAYPWMEAAWIRAAHCLDRSQPENECLELLRVVQGSTPDHVARKCQGDIRRRQGNAAFLQLVKQERFRLVVIAATEESVSAIHQALDNHQWPDGLAIHLTVLPQLLPFLGGSHDAT